MNARKFLNVRVSLTLTALALSGAFALSALTTACSSSSGGSSGSGGTAGNSGNGGSGGPAGGAAGSSTTPAGGNGGSSGNSCADAPKDSVNFCYGQAQGLLQGYAYIALGAQDSASDPICQPDSTKPDTRTIGAPDDGSCTGGQTCPTTGRTVWNAVDKLCITGAMPVVTASDYKHNWGLQIGMNTSAPPAAEGGQTFGEMNPGASYNTITVSYSGAVDPTNTAIRVIIHTKGMAPNCSDNPYCSTLTASGKTLDLTTAFNTGCWDGSGTDFDPTAADDGTHLQGLQNIDKIGIQISSDNKKAYTATNFCLESIVFGN